MIIKVLLIGSAIDLYWYEAVQAALDSKWMLKLAAEDEAINLFAQSSYDIIIIDEDKVKDIFAIISSFLDLNPVARIIVANGYNPPYRRSRDIYLAGVKDHLERSENLTPDILKPLLVTVLIS